MTFRRLVPPGRRGPNKETSPLPLHDSRNSPRSAPIKANLRTDDYGGSIEKRARFLREVVEAVSAEWPANRVGVWISPNGVFNDMGSPNFREQFTQVATLLGRYGLAYLHVVDGLAFGFHKLGEPMTLGEFRRVFRGPLMGNCGYTRESAEQALAAGRADLIAFGRPYISAALDRPGRMMTHQE